MSIKLGVVMDPIDSITVKKDTTLAMLLAAQKRGWVIHYMLQSDLYMDQGSPRAAMHTLSVMDDENKWFELGSHSDQALAELDVILMRKDPPFNLDYIYSTYLLERAQSEGTLIVNDPQSLRDCNEKLFATQFPQCCPPVLVASAENKLKAFHQEHEDVIYKPLDGMGGTSIFRAKKDDSNLSVIIETLTEGGQRQIMAQKYIPEITDGDKRILLIDGEPVNYCLARVPAIGESRGNLAAGGNGIAQELSDRDRWICDEVSPALKERGLLFVGLDVIGDYLTEINVTSPTCVREIDRAQNLEIAGDLMDCIQSKLEAV
ncbi:MAG: glutathione synthase [Gammaproteobacteria bacterium]|nr:glutathione synthase [Gammaproteobacteria bacterium]MDD9896507.1 glutathione synthase [Gammaproteobacteria bacterium]MDD9958738.1 glutathione synthase [Gammaproteobacteria bacterium]